MQHLIEQLPGTRMTDAGELLCLQQVVGAASQWPDDTFQLQLEQQGGELAYGDVGLY